MSMRIDMTWHDDEAITFQASCADCEYTSHPFEDEEAARTAWASHPCS